MTFSTYSAVTNPVVEPKFRRYINVTGQYEGFHWWPDAPEQVAFLRARHRHLFEWHASIEVYHDDRELEFFIVKDLIQTQIVPFISGNDNLGSCEQQAERIIRGLLNAYGKDRWMSVTVSEDDENSGEVTYEPGDQPSR